MKAIQSKKVKELTEQDTRSLIKDIQFLLNNKLRTFNGVKKL